VLGVPPGGRRAYVTGGGAGGAGRLRRGQPVAVAIGCRGRSLVARPAMCRVSAWPPGR